MTPHSWHTRATTTGGERTGRGAGSAAATCTGFLGAAGCVLLRAAGAGFAAGVAAAFDSASRFSCSDELDVGMKPVITPSPARLNNVMAMAAIAIRGCILLLVSDMRRLLVENMTKQ